MFSKIIQNIPILLIALFSVLLSQNLKAEQSGSALKTRVSDDTVMVKFIPGVKGEEKRNAHAQANGKVKKSIEALGIDVIEVPKGSVNAAMEVYRRNPNVVYAEPDYIRPMYIPSTTEGSEPFLGIENNFTEQYGLHNTGQEFGAVIYSSLSYIYPAYKGTADADINAPEAWQIAIDNNITEPVGVAVLDSGVECTHLDFENGCIEEINCLGGGCGVGSVADILQHGTHVAGIIAATQDNSLGIAGVSPNARIGAIKVCWETVLLGSVIDAGCNDSDIADALAYVADSNKYEVINMSLAGTQRSDPLEDAVAYAWSKGLVIVAAAGNSYTTEVHYPAGFDDVIAVGATDFHDNLAAYSTFSDSSTPDVGHWVSVLAPGTAIMSTMPEAACTDTPVGDPSDCYHWQSGTSMAAPHVAGLAAILAADPAGYSNAEIRDIIEGSAADFGALGQNFGAWVAHGRIDMAAAVNYSPEVDPPVEPPVTEDYSVSSIVTGIANADRGKKYAQATVTILNGENPAVDVSVKGSFSFYSDANPEDVTVSTDSNGVAVLTTSYSEKGITFEVCVTSINGEAIPLESQSCASFL